MIANVFEPQAVGTATQTSAGIPVNELNGMMRRVNQNGRIKSSVLLLEQKDPLRCTVYVRCRGT